MNNTPNALPEFSNPPLVEVVLSVQFEKLTRMGIPQLGLLWAEMKEKYPRTEEHPLLEPVKEVFGARQKQRMQFQVEMLETPPIPRVWFLEQLGCELMQIQQDRIIHNWRKVKQDNEYPRYDKIREAFKSDLESFQKFLLQEKLGNLIPDQCEVTYLNQIVADDIWESHNEINKVIPLWSWNRELIKNIDPEDVRFNARYIISDEFGAPLGRLHTEVQPAYRGSNGTPIFILNLTARGAPKEKSIEGVLTFMDVGRESIVRTFASITANELHEKWGRCDEC
jgi:uncharacterized protein (TIGR04255 family)